MRLIWACVLTTTIGGGGCDSRELLPLPDTEGAPVIDATAPARSTREIHADLDVGGMNGFGHVADVAGTGDGGFGVLDRREQTLLIYGPDGDVRQRLGRPGDGPGEFRDPIAATWTGVFWVVWDRDPNKTFTIFEATGHVVQTIRRPVDGDWRANMFRRGPRLREYPYTSTLEDLTQRLRAAGDSCFVHIVQPDEQQALRRGVVIENPPATIIRYTIPNGRLDTLQVLDGVRSFQTGDGDYTGAYFEQPVFSSRPVWAGSNEWIVAGHGDSTYLTVSTTADTATHLRIRVANHRRGIHDRDRQAWGAWVHRYTWLTTKDRDWIEGMRKPDYIARVVEMFEFAEHAPLFHNIYVAGNCLWIGDFDPHAEVDGGATRFTVMSLTDSHVHERIVLDARGHRIHDIDKVAIYTSYHDDNGLFHVVRWPHGTCKP